MKDNEITIKIGEAIDDLPALIEVGIIPLLVAEPGVGKSQICEQLAADHGWDFELYHPAMGMPSDIKGLPFKKSDDEAGFLPYELMVRIQNANTNPDKILLVLIDDMIQATDLMKAAIMQLVEARKINGKSIPDNVRFAIATNDAKHNAGGTRIISPLIGRSCVVHLEVDPKHWIKWGIETKRIVAEVLFFIQTYPESLSHFVSTKSIQNVPSPRNWERVSKLVSIDKAKIPYISGCVGETEATRFTGFLKIIERLKGKIPAILKTPESAEIIQEPDTFFALVLALSHNATENNLKAIYTYLQRCNAEFAEFGLAQIVTLHPKLKESEIYINHLCKQGI
jgi:hypothetical protein